MRLPRYPVLVTAALLGSQCSFDPHESGELCIYTARSEGQIQREIEAFVAGHPGIRLRCPEVTRNDSIICADGSGDECDRDEIAWEVFRQSTGTLTDTIAAQSRAELPADVLWGVAVSHVRYLYNRDPRLLRRYKPQHTFRVEQYLAKKDIPEYSFWWWFLDPTYQSKSLDEPLWVGVDAFTVAFCVNTRKLAELPAPNSEPDAEPLPLVAADLTWQTLLDPRLTGKVAAPQPNQAGTGFAQLAATLRPDFAPCDGDAAQCGRWAELAALDAQVGIYTKSGDLPCELAAQKSSPIVVGITHDAADFFHARDPDDGSARYYDSADVIARVLPDDTGFDVAVSALIDRPDLQPAAQTFLDWASSPEAMALYAISTPLTAYNPAAVDLPRDLLARLQDLAIDFQAAAAVMDELKMSWSCQFCRERPAADDLDPALVDALIELDENNLETLDLETIGRCHTYACDRSDP